MAKRTRIISDGGTFCEGHVHVDTPDGRHREFVRGAGDVLTEVQGNGAKFPVLSGDGRTPLMIYAGETPLDAVRRLHKARAI